VGGGAAVGAGALGAGVQAAIRPAPSVSRNARRE
jgi:hypothetical protein